jgi:molybdopterin synthase sulfur carrier subunit
MAVTVRIPSPLQPLVGGHFRVEASGATLREVLDDLGARFPGVRERLYDDDGNLRRFVNLYVNDDDVRVLQGEDTALGEGDEVSIIPAIAGGNLSEASGGAF